MTMGEPGPLFVYIEGDGLAYLDTRTPSTDPTPVDPLALRLAAADPGPAVLYLGRPCQFAPGRGDPRCSVRAWTTARFGANVVASIDDAISRERARAPERPLVLVGYSGGGVIAALVAARRKDVSLLITVAAPLDVADWTRRMGVSPLDGSEASARSGGTPLQGAAGRLCRTERQDSACRLDCVGHRQIRYVGGADRRAGLRSSLLLGAGLASLA